jgi:hypothetical protein
VKRQGGEGGEVLVVLQGLFRVCAERESEKTSMLLLLCRGGGGGGVKEGKRWYCFSGAAVLFF